MTTLTGKKLLDFPDTAVYPLYAIVQAAQSTGFIDSLDCTHSATLPMVTLDSVVLAL